MLKEHALALGARNRDGESEPVLRRALSIQQAAPKGFSGHHRILNTPGNLLGNKKNLREAGPALSMHHRHRCSSSVRTSWKQQLISLVSGCSRTKPANLANGIALLR
jgi:hypothetical protein